MAARKVAESRDPTVSVFARRWIDETLFYRSPACVAQIVRWLDAYIDPAIGDMQRSDVQPGDVLAIIKVRADTPVTAERIRVIVQQFYNHAIRNLLVTMNAAQPLRGAVARAPAQHHRHLREKELGAFWRKLDEQGAYVTTVAASKLLMLTMTCKGELLRSKWREFDLDAAQWDLPVGVLVRLGDVLQHVGQHAGDVLIGRGIEHLLALAFRLDHARRT